MLDIKTSMKFRREVCDDIDNVLGGIEHIIKSTLGSESKAQRVAEYKDRLDKCYKTLSFIDEWVGSRMLDPKGH